MPGAMEGEFKKHWPVLKTETSDGLMTPLLLESRMARKSPWWLLEV